MTSKNVFPFTEPLYCLSVEGLLGHCFYFEGIFLLKIDLAASLSLIKFSCEYVQIMLKTQLFTICTVQYVNNRFTGSIL
jgi:hypothetical protein